MFLEIDQMRSHMVFHDLGHETCHGPASARDEMHDLLTPRLIGEGPLNTLDLPADSAHACQQLSLIANRMAHRVPS